MVRVYPMRADQLDDHIRSFPLTTISHRLGELFSLMPCDGSPDAGAWNRPAAYDQETLTPYYYATSFDHSLIRTEFTPAEHCGYFRFTFPSGKGAVLLANRFPGELSGSGSNTVTGIERFHDMQAFLYGDVQPARGSSPTAARTRTRAAGRLGSRRPAAVGVSLRHLLYQREQARNKICAAKFPPGPWKP